jgi:predicted phosphoadenosine phosphosulfate sulfurtransferase
MGRSILKRRFVNQDVFSLALERIERIYQLHDHVTVSFSAGKDSSIILHLALQVAKSLNKLPLRILFIDEEICLPETIDYVRQVKEMDG